MALSPSLRRLPPLMDPSNNYRIWMSDFLWGSMVFNWVALAQYAALCYGLEKQKAVAAKKAAVGVATAVDAPCSPSRTRMTTEVQPAELSDASASRQTGPDARPGKWRERVDRGLVRLVHLDSLFRWLFPLTYLLFAVVMVSIADSYDFKACQDGF